MAERSGQQHYWDRNLDARNLGGDESSSPDSLLEELKFCGTPDIEQMTEAMRAGAGNYILEIGSGLGANAVLMAQHGAAVIALDISHERLAAMRSRTSVVAKPDRGNIYPVKARAEALPFRNGVLDGACSRAVLIHTDLPVVCTEVARVLKPGAPIAFSEPMKHNPLVNIYRLTLAPKEWRDITTYFTHREITTVARHFTGVAARRYYITAFLAFGFQYAVSWPRWFYAALAPLMKFDAVLMRLWPRARRYAWFVLINGRNREP